MAHSPASERRARVIREIAQELNSTRHSMQSNSEFADFTNSNLTIDEESSEAYRDNSQHLPTLPDHKVNTRLAKRPSGDFVIDSSAIARAFPDITGSASSVDDGSSISIELGRGLGDGVRNLSDVASTSLGPIPGQYKVDLKRLPPRDKERVGKSSLREVQSANDPVLRSSPPPLKATNYGTSGSSGQSNPVQRRSVYQATVEDGSDHTGSSSDRQSTQNLTARSSRFGNARSKAGAPVPKRFTSGKDLLREVHQSTARANSSHKLVQPAADIPTVSVTNGITNHSFMLPNMPNMSELVSGIYDDGTPVFSRTTAGRFQRVNKPSNLRAVESLPVPHEEEAIMMSLRLLQEKVQQLERNKAEAEVVVKELRTKNRSLEGERRELIRSQRYDSGVGSSGGSIAGDEDLTGTRRIVFEKQRMQSTVRNLQNELDGANRRAAVAEANAASIASERDSAIEQLGVAFVTQEELKVDNESLKEENRALKNENQKLKLDVKKYLSLIEAHIRRADSERTETKSKATEEDSAQPETRSIDCQVLDVDTPQRPSTRRDTGVSRGTEQPHASIDVPKRRKRRVVVEEYTATSDFQGFDDETIERIRDASRNLSRNITQDILPARPSSKAASSRLAHDEANTQMSRHSKLIRPASRAATTNQVQDTLLSIHEPAGSQNHAAKAAEASRVNFLEEHDITILRKMLEREHLQKKGVIPYDDAGERFHIHGVDGQDVTQLTSHTQKLPRKSSMKDMTGVQSVRPETTVHTDIEDEEQTNVNVTGTKIPRRRHSETSMAAGKPLKARKAMDDLTSAFILPDITMNVRQRRQSHADVDATDVTVPMSIATEPTQNATVDDQATQQVSPPVLASERIKDLALEGEDHTERPSEPPADALARTIRALEDEFAQIGAQLSVLQQQYNELDPSLQKRRRKTLGASIDSLRAAMDAKGDQVYALYDVLEGQKSNGTFGQMTEQEVNETLSSVLGEDLNLDNLGMPSGIMFKRGQKTSSANVTPAKERSKPMRMSLGSDILSKISERSEHSEKELDRPGTSAGTPSRKKFPWETAVTDEDDDLSWQGFDDTLDLTKGSHKSNTSSKRKGATAPLDL